MKANINDMATFTLTEKGAGILNKHVLWKDCKPGDKVNLQLWDFANIFGEHLYNGAELSVETEFTFRDR